MRGVIVPGQRVYNTGLRIGTKLEVRQHLELIHRQHAGLYSTAAFVRNLNVAPAGEGGILLRSGVCLNLRFFGICGFLCGCFDGLLMTHARRLLLKLTDVFTRFCKACVLLTGTRSATVPSGRRRVVT